MVPFLADFDGSPSRDAVRRKAWELSLLDHVFRTSIDFLVQHEIDKRARHRTAAVAESGRELIARTEAEILRGVDVLRKKGIFPVGRNRASIFHRYTDLKRLRKLNTRNVQHEEKSRGKEHYGKQCALCTAGRTAFYCVDCCVSLCFGKCFKVWHSEDNLEQAHEAAKTIGEAEAAARKADATRKKQARFEEIMEVVEAPHGNSSVSSISADQNGNNRDAPPQDRSECCDSGDSSYHTEDSNGQDHCTLSATGDDSFLGNTTTHSNQND